MNPVIIFDLDGTLADTRADIARSVNLTRQEYGLAPLSLETVISFVGNGSAKLIRRSFSERPDLAVPELLETFLDTYARNLAGQSRLYPGVRTTLEGFHEKGWPMAVLSNKPGQLCRPLMDQLGLARFFITILGGGDLAALKPDPAGIDHIMGLLNREAGKLGRVWMVGDHNTDLDTAANAGIQSVFCEFGFGDRGGRTPDACIQQFSQLKTIIT